MNYFVRVWSKLILLISWKIVAEKIDNLVLRIKINAYLYGLWY